MYDLLEISLEASTGEHRAVAVGKPMGSERKWIVVSK